MRTAGTAIGLGDMGIGDMGIIDRLWLERIMSRYGPTAANHLQSSIVLSGRKADCVPHGPSLGVRRRIRRTNSPMRTRNTIPAATARTS